MAWLIYYCFCPLWHLYLMSRLYLIHYPYTCISSIFAIIHAHEQGSATTIGHRKTWLDAIPICYGIFHNTYTLNMWWAHFLNITFVDVGYMVYVSFFCTAYTIFILPPKKPPDKKKENAHITTPYVLNERLNHLLSVLYYNLLCIINIQHKSSTFATFWIQRMVCNILSYASLNFIWLYLLFIGFTHNIAFVLQSIWSLVDWSAIDMGLTQQ